MIRVSDQSPLLEPRKEMTSAWASSNVLGFRAKGTPEFVSNNFNLQSDRLSEIWSERSSEKFTTCDLHRIHRPLVSGSRKTAESVVIHVWQIRSGCVKEANLLVSACSSAASSMALLGEIPHLAHFPLSTQQMAALLCQSRRLGKNWNRMRRVCQFRGRFVVFWRDLICDKRRSWSECRVRIAHNQFRFSGEFG